MTKKIKTALISVFSKEGLSSLLETLKEQKVSIYSTGGTYDFLKEKGMDVHSVESLTGFPSILGGRVKTLHPLVFGGILGRKSLEEDRNTMLEYGIPEIDLVVVDLYPFEETLAMGASEKDIIEKIDIGGISLIRAAAKNFEEVLIVPSTQYYEQAAVLLKKNQGETSIEDRRCFASYAFKKSSEYDTFIANYFKNTLSPQESLNATHANSTPKNAPENSPKKQNKVLRYGENPHQQGVFYGDLSQCFTQLHGKEISYNNLLDIDAALALIQDFSKSTFAILKHNNACGLSTRENLLEAYTDALAADPVSAFGGVLICNDTINKEIAQAMNSLFFEVLLAPDFEEEALEILKGKKNRILLQYHPFKAGNPIMRSCLNGVLVQDRDTVTETEEQMKTVSNTEATTQEKADLLFANYIVKHSKSNAIVIVKNQQLISSGVGQTSRVDALRQAIEKAKNFGFDLHGAVVASDAYFPFADCVEISDQEGISAFIQPGGSIRDNLSIDYCNEHHLSMIFTGIRHFKH